MTNLEFIEKEIEAVEKELAEIVDITNDYLEIPDTYENKYNLIDDANERYSNYSLRLSKLIQIKTELEAWEVVKDARKKINFGLSYRKDIETNKIELIVSFTTEEENKETLEKALGVKDDNW